LTLIDRAIVSVLPAVPKGVVRRISSRYIAGTEIADASRVVSRLNGTGKLATVDVLGEEITSVDEASGIAREYRYVLETVERDGLDSNVSVKPTALGLKLGYSLCRRNLEHVVAHAADAGNFVRIDMEDSSTTDDTLRLYRELRAAGFDNVGVVFQAYLRRTLDDIRELAELTPNARLCKGIYLEPEEVAFQGFEEVRENFVATLAELLEGGSYVGIATHDEWLVEEGKRLVAEHGLETTQYEFQMLLGVREQLGEALVADGRRLRIYVPYGEHWYAYSLRRLQENPKLAGYIAADTFGRFIPGRNGRG
jgi:proline dehydrogenase